HEVEKAWKLAVGDWKEREHWDEYTAAYQDVLYKCATAHAPWHVVPADRKWYRDVFILTKLVETLRPYKARWLDSLTALGKERMQELTEFRSQVK
nr:polyphosphate kinase 2 family protein [Armatimonadota bacterium]